LDDSPGHAHSGPDGRARAGRSREGANGGSRSSSANRAATRGRGPRGIVGIGFAALGPRRSRCRAALKNRAAERQSKAERQNFDPGFRQSHPSNVVSRARTASAGSTATPRNVGPFPISMLYLNSSCNAAVTTTSVGRRRCRGSELADGRCYARNCDPRPRMVCAPFVGVLWWSRGSCEAGRYIYDHGCSGRGSEAGPIGHCRQETSKMLLQAPRG
jgi:hypothetical protein